MSLLRIQVLEDRILLDGAIAHDIAAPPINHANGNNVVVIADNLPDAAALKSSFSENAKVVSYDYNKDSLSTLSEKINEALGSSKADSIAFFTDGSKAQFSILNGLKVDSTTIQSIPMTDFWRQVGGYLKDNGSINILGCNVAATDQGTRLVDTLAKIVNENPGNNITVRASTNLTGSSKLGGDWIMEYSSNNQSNNFDAWDYYTNDAQRDGWNHTLSPGVNITPNSNLVVSESGSSTPIAINLNSQPTSDVSLIFTVNDSTEGQFLGGGIIKTITFTTTNWNTPQILQIQGIDDTTVDGNQTFTVTPYISSSLDPNYAVGTLPDISVINLDNDSAPVVQTRVWNDINGNGFQGGNESGIQNITVRLIQEGSNSITMTTTTDASGVATFSFLNPGTYHLEWVIPDPTTGISPSHILEGFVPTFDSDALSIVKNGNQRYAISDSFTIINNQVITDIDAGFIKSAVQTNVWQDINHNGIQDSGEAGIPGLTATLMQFDSQTNSVNEIATTTTDVNGIATFAGVAPAGYFIRWTLPNPGVESTATFGVLGGQSSNSDSDADPSKFVSPNAFSKTFLVGENQVVQNFDLGIVSNFAKVTTFVWNDSSTPNGLQDSDPGISGLQVNLYTASGIFVKALTPNANGEYSAIVDFNSEPFSPGQFYLEWQIPNGMIRTTPHVSSPNFDSNAISDQSGFARSDLFTLTNNSNVTNIDAGFVTSTGTITTFVWNDTNHNGLQDSGESGISGLTVTAINGSTTLTAIDNGGGNYTFNNVLPGNYILSWTYSNIYSATLANAGNNGNENFDSDGILTTNSGNTFTTSSATFTVGPGSSITNVDLGLTPAAGTMSTFVWNDTNHNGIQDSGEAGISGLTVTATNGSTTLTAVDNGGGNYTFNIVTAGNYTISWTYSNIYNATTPNAGNNGNDNVDSDGISTSTSGNFFITSSSSFSVAAGSSVTNVDLGLVSRSTTITTFIWNDTLNPNGLKDSTETTFSNQTAKLYDANDQFIGNFISIGNGIYQITLSSINAGNYYIQWSNPNASTMTITTPNVGGVGANNNSDAVTLVNSNQAANSAMFFINPGDTISNVNVGFLTSTGTVNTFVWTDNNQNGWQDASPLPTVFEHGIPQVSVMLVNDTNPSLNRLLTTNSLGNVTFSNVTPGTYHLEYDKTSPLLSQFGLSPLNVFGSNSNFDSDIYVSSNTTNPNWVRTNSFNVGSSGIVNLYDAGFTPTAVTTFVWNDANGNGIIDPSEGGISDATVYVNAYTSSNTLITQFQMISLGAGSYSYRGLPNIGTSIGGMDVDHYLIQWVLGPNTINKMQTTIEGLNSDPSTGIQAVSPVLSNTVINSSNLTSPGSSFQINAGFISNYGTITTYVWNDANHNGLKDVGETGFAGVTVKAINDGTNTQIGSSASTDLSGKATIIIPLAPGSTINVHLDYSSLPPGTISTLFDVGGLSLDQTNSDIPSGISGNMPASTRAIPITAGTVATNLNAGFYVNTATIVVNAWNDLNNNNLSASTNLNGIKDSGESAVSNLQIVLFSAEDTTYSNPILANSILNGVYTFNYIVPDTYAVGWLYKASNGDTSVYNPTYSPNQGFPLFISNDSDIFGPQVTSSTNNVYFISGPFLASANTTINSLGIGVVKGGTLTHVWQDVNPNGTFDPSVDVPISNLTSADIKLYSGVDGFTNPVNPTQYLFKNFGEGLYFLVGQDISNAELAYKIPAGTIGMPTTDTTPTLNKTFLSGITSSGYAYTNPFAFSLNTSSEQGAAFANTGDVYGSVTIKVWNDTKGDGLYTTDYASNGLSFPYNDPLINDMTSNFFSVKSNGNPISFVFSNNGDGTYTFSNLPVGTSLSITPVTIPTGIEFVPGTGNYSSNIDSENTSVINQSTFTLQPLQTLYGGLSFQWNNLSTRINAISRLDMETTNHDSIINSGDTPLTPGTVSSQGDIEVWVYLSNNGNSSGAIWYPLGKTNNSVNTSTIYSSIFGSSVMYQMNGVAIFNGLDLNSAPAGYNNLGFAWFFKNTDSGTISSGTNGGLYPASTNVSSAGSDITFAATNQNVSVFGFDTSGNGYNYVGYTGNIGAPSVAHVYLFDAIFGYNFSYSNAPNVPKGTDSNYNNLMNDSQPGYYDIN